MEAARVALPGPEVLGGIPGNMRTHLLRAYQWLARHDRLLLAYQRVLRRQAPWWGAGGCPQLGRKADMSSDLHKTHVALFPFPGSPQGIYPSRCVV